MTGPDSHKPDDSLLEDFLAGRSRVGKAYREAAQESAPPEIDQAILRMAHEEALQPPAAAPRDQDHFRDRRWPYGLAAVVVLSFSTLLLIREDPVARKAVMVDEAAMSAEMPQAPAAARPVTEALTQTPVEAAADAAPPPPPAPAREETRRARSAPPMAAPEPVEDYHAEPPAAAAETAPAPQPQMSAPAAPPVLREQLRKEEGRGASMDAPAAKSLGGASMADSMERDAEAPEQWLQRIRELLAQGQREQARRELQAFREAWPQVEIPEDLRALQP
ncbi:MAG TPA: hypothetical protein VLI06_18330 [Solimonas sp.]|nr:hypothetical protein [Solimonas sp.]